ncbi:unnamed protein product [Diamesa tonsa]
MWEKETLYKLQLKINLVQDFCKKAFSESQNYDLIFVTKDNKEIPAHRLMLSISSLFFKNCVETYEHYEVLKILLPDYSFEATYSFLSFLYSGEVLMEKCLQTEFLALCEEFKVEIPNLKSLMESENINPTEDLTESDNNPIEELTEVEGQTPTYEQTESVFICEESIENAIEYQVEDTAEDNDDDLQEYYTTIEEYPKKISPDIDKVAQMVFDGEIRLLKAAEFYQIPKSTLHRRLQKIRSGYREVKIKIDPKTPIKSTNYNLEAAVQDVLTKALTYSGAELKYGISKSIIFRTIHDRRQSEDPVTMTPLQISNKAKVRARVCCSIADQNYSKNLDLAEESIKDEGLTIMEAARKFGIPKTSMYRHMSKVKTDSSPTETTLKDAIEEVLNGNPLSPTALKYNVSKSTLHRHVQRKSKQMIDELDTSL